MSQTKKEFRFNPNPGEILLTGATGFLGAFLLDDLLERTAARIHCLVRGATYWEAEERIIRNFEHFKLRKPDHRDRIVPVVGDLSKPLFDLPERDFKRLAGLIDAIYHSGATVNFVSPYSRLKATNVLGTQETLRLAGDTRLKPMHFISTLRIFGTWEGRDGVVGEDDQSDQSQVIQSGYSQSKWVAEKLVRTAGERGIPVTIFRPGIVTGDTVNGMANLADIIGRLIKGCIEMQCAPQKEMLLDLTPVDWVSKALVHLSLMAQSIGKTFHLVTPHPLRWTELSRLIHELGYPIRQVSYDEWLGQLTEGVRENRAETSALAPLMSYFVEELPDEVANRRFDCQNVLDGLESSGLECPKVDLKLLRTYMQAYIREGFIPSPSVPQAETA